MEVGTLTKRAKVWEVERASGDGGSGSLFALDFSELLCVSHGLSVGITPGE